MILMSRFLELRKSSIFQQKFARLAKQLITQGCKSMKINQSIKVNFYTNSININSNVNININIKGGVKCHNHL